MEKRFIIIILLLASPHIQAELRENYQTSRALGMGDAQTAIANDDGAPWYNPAGTGRVRKTRSRGKVHLVKIPNVTAAANKNGSVLLSAYRGDAEGVSKLSESTGSGTAWARAAGFPVMFYDFSRQRPAAFGLFANSINQVSTDTSVSTDTTVTSMTDVGALTSLAFANPSNRGSIGFSLRPTYRYAYDDIVSAETLANKSQMQERIKANSTTGFGLGVDFGAMFTVADFWFPTIAVAAKNLPLGCRQNYLNPYTEKRETVCGTLFQLDSTQELGDLPASVDPTDFRAGFSITPRLSRMSNFRVALDAHHVAFRSGENNYGLYGVDAGKMVHGGIEYFYGNPMDPAPAFSARVGLNQGFMTYGVSLNLGGLYLDFASYGVDTSTTVKPVEDRRYAGNFSLLF